MMAQYGHLIPKYESSIHRSGNNPPEVDVMWADKEVKRVKGYHDGTATPKRGSGERRGK